MNCTTAQGKPCATQRTIMPNAEEDFPLPAPVWTMVNPFSPLFSAIIGSGPGFFFASLAAWRASSAKSCSGTIGALLRLDKLQAWANGGSTVGSCPTTGEE